MRRNINHNLISKDYSVALYCRNSFRRNHGIDETPYPGYEFKNVIFHFFVLLYVFMHLVNGVILILIEGIVNEV